MLEAHREAFKGCGLGAAMRGSPRDHELPLSPGVAAGLRLRSWSEKQQRGNVIIPLRLVLILENVKLAKCLRGRSGWRPARGSS